MDKAGCTHQMRKAVTAPLSDAVAGRRFHADLPAEECVECGDVSFASKSLSTWEDAIAAELARTEPVNGESFKFIRKSLLLSGQTLAELLDVTPTQLSRWEHGKAAVGRATWALVAAMLLEKIAGRSDTMDRLRAVTKRQPKRVSVTFNQVASPT
jgi:DNA-binding transcriptional regulator YiaG